jgi:hypothetical protein
MKRRGAIARDEEDYFVFGAANKQLSFRACAKWRIPE